MNIDKFCLNDRITLEKLEGGISRKILSNSSSLMTVEVYFEVGAEGQLHRHEHEQITYVLEGEFDFTVNGKTQKVKKGDTIYMEPKCMHGAICTKKGMLLDIFTPPREDFLK